MQPRKSASKKKGASSKPKRGPANTDRERRRGDTQELSLALDDVARVIDAVARGDLDTKMPLSKGGQPLQDGDLRVAVAVNELVDKLRTVSSEMTRVAREVGTEGKLGGQARVAVLSGTWKDLTDNVNLLAGNLTTQVRNIALVTTAVAHGDLSQKITVDARGEILELKNTINGMVDQLRTFAAEVTRVAREVGTEGKLGGQAVVPGVAGTWQDLTKNVNLMASNLTGQVRGIVKVVTAVAEGNLSKKLTVEAKGEIAALADTINDMTTTLGTFADQVTTVAREVGIEGKLGGQAKVPGAAGTWRDLTDNVNQLAGNLTTQVRAISTVAVAVTKGDLTRTIDVEARGEVLSLKDTINQMIANLRDTTQTNQEQDWLKTNLAKFSQMMQGQRSLENLADLVMSELTPLVSAQHATFFVTQVDTTNSRPYLRLLSSYAFKQRKDLANRFALGEGLVGQCALEKKLILVSDVPRDYTNVINSSLGFSAPRTILVLPILFEGEVKGVIELASFQQFLPIHITFLEQLMLSIGVVFNMIAASSRTEELLKELKGSNVELEKRTDELEEKASLLEVKNREIAEASASLEEKAEQLALVSKYKSEFLANMSHELRTPLNSLLVLAKLLSENQEATLSTKEVEYAQTIFQSGSDLLSLINQILDLSKIEAGKMEVEKAPMSLDALKDYVERTFSPLGRERDIDFAVAIAPGMPKVITTDAQRLHQILKNLLSNAFKFTDEGRVTLSVDLERQWSRLSSPALRMAPAVMAFSVTDSGIGIAKEQLELVFEAFQQADSSTNRTYGGTGLGLTISRELARLLGGEIQLDSTVGRGSRFTLYLPLTAEDIDYVRVPDDAAFEPQNAVGPVSAQRLSGRTVLLVDDDIRNLFAMTSLLERSGAKVYTARSAREALAALTGARDIEILLLDIMMPDIDGYQVAKEIRRTPSIAQLPIVAVTAKAMPGDRELCLAAGCNDFVPKPLDADELLATLGRWLPDKDVVT